MGIYGLGQYGYFQSNYHVSEIPRVDAVPPVQPVAEQNNLSELTSQPEMGKDLRGPVNPNEISIGINKNDDFSYIGRDKDVENLDIRKAISDMKQDSILQEYTYFVGDSKNIFQSEDGKVFMK